MADLPDNQFFPQTIQPGITKEKELIRPEASDLSEKVLIIESGKIAETEAEKEGYIERLEKEIELKKSVVADDGQVLVTSPAAQTPKIVLPIREESYLNPANWHRPVVDAIRWLLEWTKRIIKMKPEETVFQESKE